MESIGEALKVTENRDQKIGLKGSVQMESLPCSRVYIGVGGIFALGVSCVRVTC